MAAIILAAMRLPTASGAPRDPSNLLGLTVVGSLFVIGFIIFGLMHFVNKTVIEGNSTEVTCRATPISLSMPNRFPVVTIDRFFVKTSTSRRPAAMIGVKGKNASMKRLVMRTPSVADAVEICRELDSHYGTLTG